MAAVTNQASRDKRLCATACSPATSRVKGDSPIFADHGFAACPRKLGQSPTAAKSTPRRPCRVRSRAGPCSRGFGPAAGRWPMPIFRSCVPAQTRMPPSVPWATTPTTIATPTHRIHFRSSVRQIVTASKIARMPTSWASSRWPCSKKHIPDGQPKVDRVEPEAIRRRPIGHRHAGVVGGDGSAHPDQRKDRDRQRPGQPVRPGTERGRASTLSCVTVFLPAFFTAETT